jgi:hypothetical protein
MESLVPIPVELVKQLKEILSSYFVDYIVKANDNEYESEDDGLYTYTYSYLFFLFDKDKYVMCLFKLGKFEITSNDYIFSIEVEDTKIEALSLKEVSNNVSVFINQLKDAFYNKYIENTNYFRRRITQTERNLSILS